MTRHVKSPNTVLIVSFDAYPKSTRARKAALAYAAKGYDVRFLGMSAPGRTGRWAPAGTTQQDGIRVHLVPMRQPETAPSARNVVLNVIRSYLPALSRMARIAWRTDADVAHVVSTPLTPIATLHKARNRSKVVLDVTERPGVLAAKGSANTLASRAEGLLLQLGKVTADVVTAVVTPDVDLLRAHKFRSARLVRNAPLSSWRAAFYPPTQGKTRYALIGSIFEGRGYEMLLQAVAADEGRSDYEVHVFGSGRDEYISSLVDLANTLGVGDRVHFQGWIAGDEVSGAYLTADVGLVLYEGDDPGNDGLSNKILECVSTGRPVIAGDLPENRRFIDENQVGWLTAMNPAALSERLASTAQEVEEIHRLSAHCRAIGDSWLTWEQEFLRVIDELERKERR